MTKKLRLLVIAVFVFIASVCLLAGCALQESLDDVLAGLDKKGALVDVTYFANEGSFIGDTKVRNLRCTAGGRAISIGINIADSNDIAISPANKYELEGWYEAVLDSDGNAVYEDGSTYTFNYDPSTYNKAKLIKSSDKAFDFENTVLEAGKHYYLVAKYRKVKNVQVVLAGEAPSITYRGKEYKTGDLLNELTYQSNRIPKPSNAISGVVTGGTFVEFYADKDCSEIFTGWPIQLSDHENDEEPFTIYARYIVGSWTVVKNASGVSDMFNGLDSEGKQYFIFGEIDCSNLTVDARTGEMGVSCTVVGDEGSKITGLTVGGSFTIKSSADSASLFGIIKSGAKLSNLVFEDINQEYTVYEDVSISKGIYFVFTSKEEGATIEGVKLSGKMTVTISTSQNTEVSNLVNGEESDNWKFGGYTSDDEYIEDGLTVEAELKVEYTQ